MQAVLTSVHTQSASGRRIRTYWNAKEREGGVLRNLYKHFIRKFWPNIYQKLLSEVLVSLLNVHLLKFALSNKVIYSDFVYLFENSWETKAHREYFMTEFPNL